uniref:mitogen-activated protein kinase kinase n=1 Tax=Acrobeloides nanus TaxID=290746 RepID=A0A914E245_9BILA
MIVVWDEQGIEELLNCVIVAVLKALAACKAKNIMHRDVKPDNILLGKNGAIKLIDFGESRVLENSMASTFAGSLTYWPPERFDPGETNTEQPDAKTNTEQPDAKTNTEQSDAKINAEQPDAKTNMDQGDPDHPTTESEQPSNSTTSTQTYTKAKYDVRADIWSLGITLIEVVSGTVPYRDKKGNIPNNIILLQNLIITLNPNITVDERFNGYSEEIKDFVKSCLRKEKERPKYSDLLVTKFYKNLETIDSETLVKRVMEKYHPTATQRTIDKKI